MADPNSDEKVRAWLIKMLTVLPGFISLATAQYIVGQGDLGEFEIVSYSLVLSLVSFLVALTLYRGGRRLQVKVKSKIWPDHGPVVASGKLAFSLPFAFLVLAVAIGVGVLCGHVYGDDLLLRHLEIYAEGSGQTRVSFTPPLVHLMALNQRARIGERDGRPQPLDKEEAWVVLFTKAGKQLEGYPMLYSLGDAASREIYLSPACTTGDVTEPWPGPGMVVREDEIESVGFVDRHHSRCLKAWTLQDTDSTVSPDSPVAATKKNTPPR